MRQLRDRYADEIRKRFPQIPRRVSGYNLDELLPEHGFHVARALVGSEGTCATVLGATLDLMHSPPCRRLVGSASPTSSSPPTPSPRSSNTTRSASKASTPCSSTSSAASISPIEDLNSPSPRRRLPPRRIRRGNQRRSRSQGPRSHRRLIALRRSPHRPHLLARRSRPHLAHSRIRPRRHRLRPRRAATAGKAGRTPPSLPPGSAPTSAHIFALMKEYGYRSPMYGHFGQGCVHMRINFDLEIRARHSQIPRRSSTRPPTSSSPTAARSPASTATARPAARCSPKCLAPT